VTFSIQTFLLTSGEMGGLTAFGGSVQFTQDPRPRGCLYQLVISYDNGENINEIDL